MREYAVVFCVAAAATYLLTPLARRFAIRIHAMTAVRDRDVHTIPTPRLGGLAMYAGIAVALLVAYRLPALQVAFKNSSEVKAVLAGGAVVCLLGAVDDKWSLDALTKLAGQIVAAGVVVVLGVQLLYVPITSTGTLSLTQDIAVPATILLALLTINAINFIDGLDGLAAGVGAIVALAFFAFSYHLSVVQGVERASPPTLIMAVTAGACLGFLPHNFNPARVFMGDSGAYLVGLMLAGAMTTVTGQVDPGGLPPGESITFLLPVLLPLAVLSVPFLDLALAVVRRTRAGRSPFSPDKAHLHHRLLEIGHSHVRAVLVMYGWTSLIAFGAVTVSITGGTTLVLAVIGALALLAAVASTIPRLRPRRSSSL